MKGEILRGGVWQIPYKATHVMCADGKERTATLTREPDTSFTIPGNIKVKGKTVTGFVWVNLEGELEFSADSWRKNAGLLTRKGVN